MRSRRRGAQWRDAHAGGFRLLPKRWIVERTFGWFARCRRLAKDFENLARSHSAVVILAMIRVALSRSVNARKNSQSLPMGPKKRATSNFIVVSLIYSCNRF